MHGPGAGRIPTSLHSPCAPVPGLVVDQPPGRDPGADGGDAGRVRDEPGGQPVAAGRLEPVAEGPRPDASGDGGRCSEGALVVRAGGDVEIGLGAVEAGGRVTDAADERGYCGRSAGEFEEQVRCRVVADGEGGVAQGGNGLAGRRVSCRHRGVLERRLGAVADEPVEQRGLGGGAVQHGGGEGQPRGRGHQEPLPAPVRHGRAGSGVESVHAEPAAGAAFERGEVRIVRRGGGRWWHGRGSGRSRGCRGDPATRQVCAPGRGEHAASGDASLV